MFQNRRRPHNRPPNPTIAKQPRLTSRKLSSFLSSFVFLQVARISTTVRGHQIRGLYFEERTHPGAGPPSAVTWRCPGMSETSTYRAEIVSRLRSITDDLAWAVRGLSPAKAAYRATCSMPDLKTAPLDPFEASFR